MNFQHLAGDYGQKIKNFIVSDFWRKLMALFLAALLYYYGTTKNRESYTPERISGVPVEVELPPDAVNTDRGVSPVTLHVTGTPDDIKNLTASSFSGKIQAFAFVSGKPYRHMLSPADFRGPDGITIQSVEPRELVLNIEKVISRRIPIEVKFDSLDRLPPDYRLDRVTCTPDEVLVTGPESQVNEMRMVSTMPIPLDSSVTDGFDFNARMRNPDGVTVSPSRVAVRIGVIRKFATRTFRGIPVTVLMSPEQQSKLTAVPLTDQLEIEVSGSESMLRKIDGKNLKPFLDLTGVDEPGISEVTAGCLLSGVDDSELKIKLIRPERVRVRIRRKAE